MIYVSCFLLKKGFSERLITLTYKVELDGGDLYLDEYLEVVADFHDRFLDKGVTMEFKTAFLLVESGHIGTDYGEGGIVKARAFVDRQYLYDCIKSYVTKDKIAEIIALFDSWFPDKTREDIPLTAVEQILLRKHLNDLVQ